MLHSPIDNQKGTRKLLVDLLFKKGYCLCIPDPNLIKLQLEQVRSSWIQRFLLSKNTLEFSVVPMFMLIFIKNKCLTADQNKQLLELIEILISQAEVDTIDQIFFASNIQQMAWIYNQLAELISFTLEDFVSSDKNSKRIMTMAAAIELLFNKASLFTVTKFTLNTENNGFNILHKLFYSIAYESLHPTQIIYLSAISKKIIAKTTNFGIETLSFQIQRNGFSFIWSVLGTWLQLVFEPVNSNQFKVNHYTNLINCLFKKIHVEKLSSILLENEAKGYIIILRYLFFQQFRFNPFHYDLRESCHFKRWCQKIFSALSLQEIELILNNLSLLLSNDSHLSQNDRQQLMQNFFTYLLEFCHLQPLEMTRLRELQEQLEDRFFPSNEVIKFFKQLRVCCSFFNPAKLLSSNRSKKGEIFLYESNDLLIPECARLNTNYLTMK
ncbi:MAG: hypothetical protein E6K54_04465 [Gammaproteobacteria bacterium]|nr:MAG: hypothetical protein E6K54_04465 [Gammaproteobacteria bacterium]